MKSIHKLVVVAAFGLLAGCATIIDGKTQKLTFNSNPNGAKVLINGVDAGVTPLTIEWQRASVDLNIEFRKDGYESHMVALDSSMNMTFLGNIITGGLFGTSTDAGTGALYQYQPNTYQAMLQPKTANLDQWKREVELTKFMMVSYSQLVAEIERGQGEHLDSLMTQLAVAEGDRAAALASLRDLRAASADAQTFASKVVARFAAA